jgi:hypothetical protein
MDDEREALVFAMQTIRDGLKVAVAGGEVNRELAQHHLAVLSRMAIERGWEPPGVG